ncbi:MAG: tryptophan synthase subunit alpha [Pseudomonadota bacterium]
MSRIAARFAALQAEGRGGLIPYICAGDPDLETSQAIVDGLPAAGADLIELGAPFSDPTADGPTIQIASRRARQAGGSLRATLEMARAFRTKDAETPLIVMGYYNPLYAMGPAKAAQAAADAGVDGLIVVDLPPEEAGEFTPALAEAGVDLIRLSAPTSDDARLDVILNGATGFLYYVAVLGVTGGASADAAVLQTAVTRLKRKTTLPVAVGFGIKQPIQAAATAQIADAAVVGSALCETIGAHLDDAGRAQDGLVDAVLSQTRALADAVRAARAQAAQ